MIYIPAEKVKKDNSNLFRYSIPLFKAMRKENFAKIRLDDYFKYLLVTQPNMVDPYPACDFALDFESFCEKQSPDDQKFLRLFMLGLTPKELSQQTGKSWPNVYFRINKLRKEFQEFING